MPNTLELAIQFLETQWSSVNSNKIKGIEAEIRFESYLNSPSIKSLYSYLIPGGWIISPGKNTNINPTTKGRIAILPIPTPFSWTIGHNLVPFSAQVQAETYFKQAGIETFFTKYDTQKNLLIENSFKIPKKLDYSTSYDIEFHAITGSGLTKVQVAAVMKYFTFRTGLIGMRTNSLFRIDRNTNDWKNSSIVTQLFWKEYSRYFLHRTYLVSSNDLDFFLIGKSGKSYPIEFKRKSVVTDLILGNWFGIDIGPFSKLSFFVSLSNNMEALYFIEEVDLMGTTMSYWGVKFSDLLKYCYWVSQSGGTGMGGGLSNTVKVPAVIFENLTTFLPKL